MSYYNQLHPSVLLLIIIILTTNTMDSSLISNKITTILILTTNRVLVITIIIQCITICHNRVIIYRLHRTGNIAQAIDYKISKTKKN